MWKRLAAVALCVAVVFVVPDAYPRGGPAILQADDVAWVGVPEIVPRASGLEVRFTAAPLAKGFWSFQLLGPRGERSSVVKLEASPGEHAVVVTRPRVRALRGAGAVADGDLRLVVKHVWRDSGSHQKEGVALVDRWLRAPRVRVLGDRELLAGTRHAPRVMVTERFACDKGSCSEVPAAGAELSVSLTVEGDGGQVSTAVAVTDASGSAPLILDVPDHEGTARLEITARLNGLVLVERADVRVVRKGRVLLTLDKPLYQPGQTIHLRALARAAGTGLPIGDAPARFVVHDAKGNKVFQKAGRTSPDGVFAGRMDVAERVNVGRWRIEAHVGDETSDKTVEVKPYVLPKFKVSIAPDRAYWAPGDVVTGTIRADYFFGKPVAAGAATLTINGADAGAFKIAVVKLSLDKDGAARFSFPLPDAFAAATHDGGATVTLAGRVTDAAGQTEERSASVTVASEPLRVVAMPEAGTLVPGLPNHVFFVVTRPDGAPVARATLHVQTGTLRSTPLLTDERGVALWAMSPPAGEPLVVDATAPDGARTLVTLSVKRRDAASAQILLRPAEYAPRAGEALALAVFATPGINHTFVDVVSGGQTLVTLSAPVVDGKADFAWTIPPELAGTVLVHAWAFGPKQAVLSDTRPLVVQSADELTIKAVADKAVWRPGETASVDLFVTDRAGRPAAATLGVSVVDEAVFALSDAQPGLEKVFFLLEREVMKPKVEFHAFDAAEVFFAPTDSSPGLAAAVLSAAVMPSFSHAVRLDSRDGGVASSETLWREVFDTFADGLRRKLTAWVKKVWREPRVAEAERILAAAGVRGDVTPDWFGVPFVVAIDGDDEVYAITLRSAGRDAAWNTADDLAADLGLADALEPIWQWRAKRNPGRFGVGVGAMGFGAGGGGFVRGMASRSVRRVAMGIGRPNVAAASPRLRAWFPETLFVDPELKTDAAGKASVTIPMADSITRWRMSLIASDRRGRLGSSVEDLNVFQDFFVDVAFPNGLTRGDEVTVPIALYNYADGAQAVSLRLESDGGLEVIGEATRSVTLETDEVAGVDVRLRATRVGVGRLRVVAHGTSMSDAVERTVRIDPDGTPVEEVSSGYVREPTALSVNVPEDAVPGGDALQIKLYPGSFAVLVDGLETMLRMPSGCFEQTSSSTYPNILVLKYLRDAHKTKPELEAKALGYLQAGWQRLVTFEVPGGGFSWFGQAPANQVLTAYGLMEFADMADVMPIDATVLSRTRAWLVQKQQRDGSWAPDKSFLHQESWGDIQKSSVIITAWVAWALARTRPDRKTLDRPLRKALAYLERNAASATDPYALAYIANAYAEAAADRPRTHEAKLVGTTLGRLVKTAKPMADKMYFPTALRTATHGGAIGADVEVTALAVRAFMRGADQLQVVGPVLDWLVANKDARGNWHTTQATIQALQALVAGLGTATEAVAGSVRVRVNGADVASVDYGKEDFDVVRFVDASSHLKTGTNTIELIPSDGLAVMHQTVARSHLPWTEEPSPRGAFDVDVQWDRTTLARDDIVNVTATVKSNLPVAVAMGMLDLAVPPGFDVMAEDLEDAVARGVIQRFELAGRQIILYVPEFKPKADFKIHYRLRARFPIRASSGASRAWEYYDASNQGVAAPVALRVD